MKSKIMIKFGNHKIGDDTVIVSMGSSIDCPSRTLGLCKLIGSGITCYALKAERQYKNIVPQARKKQMYYWLRTEKEKILLDISNKIFRRNIETKYLRFNESGDFFTQGCIDKLSYIAEKLSYVNIITYGYTARSDLNFRDVPFLFKGSGYDIEGSTGMTMVFKDKKKIPKDFFICPGDCTVCIACKMKTLRNIAFIKH